MPLTLTGLEGKVAIVTGAGRMRSIGRPIAVTLAQAGCDVVLTGTGRPPERFPDDERAAGWRDIDSVADEIRALGRRALPVVSDVSKPEAVAALVEHTVREFGGVDVLVNNAGATRGTDRVPVLDLAVSEWHRVIDTNLHGTFYMAKACAQRMVEQGRGGSIVNISTLGARLLAANSGRASSEASCHSGAPARARTSPTWLPSCAATRARGFRASTSMSTAGTISRRAVREGVRDHCCDGQRHTPPRPGAALCLKLAQRWGGPSFPERAVSRER